MAAGGKIIKNDDFELRGDYTHSTKQSFNEAKINSLIKMCRELIEITKEIVFKNTE